MYIIVISGAWNTSTTWKIQANDESAKTRSNKSNYSLNKTSFCSRTAY